MKIANLSNQLVDLDNCVLISRGVHPLGHYEGWWHDSPVHSISFVMKNGLSELKTFIFYYKLKEKRDEDYAKALSLFNS